MTKKRNWDKIKTQKTEENARFRDVYEDQQLDRSHIEQKQTMLSRVILAAIAALLVGFAGWWLIAAVEMTGVFDNIHKSWYNTVYKNDGKDSNVQYVTIREQEYVYDDNELVLDEEGKPKMQDNFTRFVYNKSKKRLIDIQNSKFPVYTGTKPYVQNENGEWVKPEQENIENKEENAQIEGESQTPIPIVYQILNAPGLVENEAYLGYVDGNGDVYTDAVLETYIDYDGEIGNADDVRIENNIFDVAYMSNFGFELDANKYRYVRINRGELVDTTDSMFHDRFMDWRPTPVKLVVVLIVASATFGILYMVLKKNLDAQNIMSDTADINQYHNDQHIALPEEVQTMYDVFPDVGAHSSVMVSSMISHQMLTNKGLKKVKLAKRAKEDIKDEDGDIIVYKGDILRDDDGEPLYTEVPIIDNEFSEALFDSSKTPTEKYARKYYDAPNISYNPGNTNLDKLKDYDTVAEVINKDWEFPIYEPQRPGGMYIVDTAPVNTMV